MNDIQPLLWAALRRTAGLLLLALIGLSGGSPARGEKADDKPAAETKKEDKAAAEKKAFADEEKRRAEEKAVREKKAREAARAKAAKAAARPQNVWPDESFEQWVFGQDKAANARKRFETLLTLQVEEIDRTCRLTDEQRKKLQLVGHGDIKRVYDTFDRAKRHFNQLENDMNRLQEVMPELAPVQAAVQNSPFGDDSLMFKSLRHVLSQDQIAKYAVVVRERRAYRHRAKIELAVANLEQSMPLRDAQRRGLIELLVTETKPVRMGGDYDYYIIIDRLSHLPEEKIKALFRPEEWKVLDRQMAQFRGVLPNLRANGLIDEEDGIDTWATVPADAK